MRPTHQHGGVVACGLARDVNAQVEQTEQRPDHLDEKW